MNPDAITIDQLDKFEDLLAASCQSIHRAKLESAAGIMTPEGAVNVI